jgi:hypothetical protein
MYCNSVTELCGPESLNSHVSEEPQLSVSFEVSLISSAATFQDLERAKFSQGTNWIKKFFIFERKHVHDSWYQNMNIWLNFEKQASNVFFGFVSTTFVYLNP